MHRTTARGNRLGLGLVGLLLAAAGVALLLARRGTFGSLRATDAVYSVASRRYVHDHASWLFPVIAVVAVVLGLVLLRWLLVQPRTDRLRRLAVDSDDGSAPGAGRTRMPATALTDVVEDDIADLRGVRRVTADLSGHTDAPELWLHVTTDAQADVARVRHAITTEVLPDARAALELPELPTYVRLTVSARSGRRDLT